MLPLLLAGLVVTGNTSRARYKLSTTNCENGYGHITDWIECRRAAIWLEKVDADFRDGVQIGREPKSCLLNLHHGMRHGRTHIQLDGIREIGSIDQPTCSSSGFEGCFCKSTPYIHRTASGVKFGYKVVKTHDCTHHGLTPITDVAKCTEAAKAVGASNNIVYAYDIRGWPTGCNTNMAGTIYVNSNPERQGACKDDEICICEVQSAIDYEVVTTHDCKHHGLTAINDVAKCTEAAKAVGASNNKVYAYDIRGWPTGCNTNRGGTIYVNSNPERQGACNDEEICICEVQSDPPTEHPTESPTESPTEPAPFYFKNNGCDSLRLTDNCVETTGERYPNNVECTIGLTRNTIIEFERFEVELHRSCNWDSLQINGKKYCGYSKPSMIHVTGDIFWSTDYSVTMRGFRLCERSEGGALLRRLLQ